MIYNKKEPIALISGIKTGTWLSRKILSLLTDMDFFEPKIIPGERKYYNHKQLIFKDNHYFSWHLIPTEKVIKKLNANNAKSIFIVRNLYDLVLSIYYHFYNNIDNDIGRGNNKDTFLKQFTFEEGLSLIITGFDENNIRWNGMSEVIENCNQIFKATQQCNSQLLTYDELVRDKHTAINKIVSFLDIEIDDSKIEDIIKATSFNRMKNEAIKNNLGDSHFREGNIDSNREKLSEFHKIQLRQIIKETAPDIYENAENLGYSTIVLYE